MAFLLAEGALAQTTIAKTPAARIHVREEGGSYVRYTSKLATVLELNFTFGFDHTAGKKSISDMLTRIATDYALDGKAPFVIKKFTGPNSGGGNGLPNPAFTVADLDGAEVYVTNNISSLDQLPNKNSAMATAFESAVRGGKSVLGFHASGDGGTGWKFYHEELFPVIYRQHGNRTPAPIYKDETESRHVVLQGILASGSQKDVPMGIDGSGKEIIQNAMTRNMTIQWYRFGRNVIQDPKYGPLTTSLIKFDYRQVSTSDLAAQYRFAGGNPYLWLIKVGQGRAAYFPPGHDATETTQGANSFDGNTGDFERIYAHLLFYLAGYTKEPCGGAINCDSLPVVDAQDHLTGQLFGSSVSVRFESPFRFRTLTEKRYTARLTDVRGRLVASKTGQGKAAMEFKHSHLKPGIYVMSVQVGQDAPVLRQFMVNPASN